MKIKHYVILLLFISLEFTISSCSEKKNVVHPKEEEKGRDSAATGELNLKTRIVKISNVTTTSATVEGKVDANKESAIKERGVAWSAKGEKKPSVAGKHVRASVIKGDGTFEAELMQLKEHTVYQIRTYIKTENDVFYSDIRRVTTVKIRNIKIVLNPFYATGTTVSFVSAQVTSEEGGHVKERGICWDKDNSPDLTHSRSKIFGDGFGSFLGKIEGLNPDTRYNLKAYAVTNKDTIYSDGQVTLQTLSKGKVTYLLHKKENPSEEEKEAYKRIEKAFDTAVYYMNKFTSVTKHLDVSYSPGTPTADGNINGHINIGANAAYQRAGTVLHEIAHTVGVGTSRQWWDQLISDGVYQGNRATKMLQFMTQDSTAELHGDSQHFWPYGINGEWEDTGEDMLYIIHCLIVQGMVKDGLPVE